MAGGFLKSILTRKKSIRDIGSRGSGANAPPSLNSDFDYNSAYGPPGSGYSTPSANYAASLNPIPEFEAASPDQQQPSNTTYYPYSPNHLSPQSPGPSPHRAPSSASSFHSRSTRYSFSSSVGSPAPTRSSASSIFSHSSGPSVRGPPPGFVPGSTTSSYTSRASTSSTIRPDQHRGNTLKKPTNAATAAQLQREQQAQHAATTAEVRRAIKLLRRLFELRIRIWATSRAHVRHAKKREETKRQAEDLLGDLRGMVEEWRKMPAGCWYVFSPFIFSLCIAPVNAR